MLISMACVAYGQPTNDDRAVADSSPRFYVGSYGWFGPATQSADLTIPGYLSECGLLTAGTATTWGLGALYEFPIGDRLALGARLGVARLAGSLSARVGDPIRLDDGTLTTALVDQTVEFTAFDAQLALRMRAALFGGLHLSGGALLARTIRHLETHKQIAVAPAELLFANGQRVLTLESGTLYRPAALSAALDAGIEYDLPIARSATLTPEASASFPLSSRTTDGAWRSIALRFGASLRFGFGAADTVMPPPPPPDTPAVIAQRSPALVLSVGTEPRVVSVRIDEYDSTEVLPLFNQLFFSETSADLRREYRRLTPSETETFTNRDLVGSALDVYYHLLNIVGRRLREFPDATLAVNGYHNGRETAPGLALRRAEAVKRYLQEVWKIADRRVKVRGAGLPPNPSRETSTEGFEENARAELVPSDPNILAPILRKHIQRVATPPAITFYLQTIAEAGVSSWRLETDEPGREAWRSFSGNGMPPDSIAWNWRNDRGELPALPLQLRYRFTVTDSSGRTTTTNAADIDVQYQSVRTKLENRRNDTAIESYSILLFNYDSPKISPGDQALLRVIADAIKAHASVRLVGYTDSLGDERHNKELATARAGEVQRLFGRLLKPDATVTVDAASGGEHERFPYSTPEGRSHCRTVVIEVRTPTFPSEP